MHDDEKVIYFGLTDARNKRVRFGIKNKDRTRHIYTIGKTGMGKSTLLENLAIQDIQNGEGLAFIDPHGKSADLLLEYIPEHRKKDVVYFAPFDLDFPIAFNVLEDVGITKRHLVANGLMSAFKTIWADAFSARMEYILNNIMLALLEYPGSTLMSVNRMLTDKDFRSTVVANVTDPTVKAFWIDEYGKYTEKFAAEAAPAIQNKVGQFVGNPLVRNIIGQPVSGFDIREIMDQKKILIINLSKGRVGEANANLLGAMLITKIYLAAMSRADLSEKDLKESPQFYLYVDEFQNFANESFADILSEARKYKLSLTIANQYVEQMPEEVRAAVFGNVGTMITFRIGAYDAAVFEKEYAPEFTAEDLVNLQQYQMYLKLMIDGVTSRPFSATGIPPIGRPEISYVNEILDLSRSQFANPREKVEEDIRNWHVEKIGAKEPVKKTEGGVGVEGGRSRAPERSDRSDRADRKERPSRAEGSDRSRSPDATGRSIERFPERSRERERSVEPTRSERSARNPSDIRPRIDNGGRTPQTPSRGGDFDTSSNKIIIPPIQTPTQKPVTPLPVVVLNNEVSENKISNKSADNLNIKPVINNHVHLNSLSSNINGAENKIKNNQKDIKPENMAALREALLSVMGEGTKNLDSKSGSHDPIKNSVNINSQGDKTEDKPEEKIEPKENVVSEKNSGVLTPEDLKRILDINQ